MLRVRNIIKQTCSYHYHNKFYLSKLVNYFFAKQTENQLLHGADCARGQIFFWKWIDDKALRPGYFFCLG